MIIINGKKIFGKCISICNNIITISDGSQISMSDYKDKEIHIHGDVHGDIDAVNVIVNGNVSGDIDGTNITVRGDVDGDVDGTNVSIKKR